MIYELGERLSAYVYHDNKTRVGTVVKVWLAGETREPVEVAKYHDMTPEHRLFKVLCKPAPMDRVVLLKDNGTHFVFSPQTNFQYVTRLP